MRFLRPPRDHVTFTRPWFDVTTHGALRKSVLLSAHARLEAVKKDPRLADDRLISGKLRSKAARTGAANTSVTVDGALYFWSYRHGWVVWGKGIKAVSISVSLHPGRTRELILDFTVTENGGGATPSDARVLHALGAAIRSAREAGWDPESRGRAFRHEVAESI
jgi:hypothetical protein